MDRIAVLAAIDHFHRRHVRLGGQQLADDVFEMVSFRMHGPADAADDRAVAEEQHADSGWLLFLGMNASGQDQKKHENA